jgi:hypothetical protein
VATKIIPCTRCSGTGETIEETICPACDGTGLQTVPEPVRPSLPPIAKPSPPAPAAPKPAWWRSSTALLAALILVLAGGLLAYLIRQRPIPQDAAATVGNAPTAAADPQTTTPPPSPAPPVETPRPANPPRPRPVQYQAKHKHSLGRRCEGVASFTANAFVYESKEHPVRLSRANVVRNDGPGLKARGGKDWHFEFSGKDDKEVRSLFEDWYSRRARGRR